MASPPSWGRAGTLTLPSRPCSSHGSWPAGKEGIRPWEAGLWLPCSRSGLRTEKQAAGRAVLLLRELEGGHQQGQQRGCPLGRNILAKGDLGKGGGETGICLLCSGEAHGAESSLQTCFVWPVNAFGL